jgi:hypothetical protein
MASLHHNARPDAKPVALNILLGIRLAVSH